MKQVSKVKEQIVKGLRVIKLVNTNAPFYLPPFVFLLLQTFGSFD